MSLFGGVIPITGITFLMFSLLIITFLGYALGRISIKGVNLGTAGVFIVALLYGCFFFEPLSAQLTVKAADGTVYFCVEDTGKLYQLNGKKIVDVFDKDEFDDDEDDWD